MTEYLKLMLEPHTLALLVSLLGTWGATELVKRAFRRGTAGRNDWTPRAVAVIVGTGFGAATWPRDTEVEPWVFGLAVGLAAPLAYWALAAVLKWKWPALAKLLTGGGP